MTILVLYTDGGMIGKNPSPHGCAWAWCGLDEHGNRVVEDWGVVTAAQLGVPLVSNNIAEVVAACQALEAMPLAWSGTLWTDSQVTLCRLTRIPKFKGVPPALRERIDRVRVRVGKLDVKLCRGHPSFKDLQRGEKRGLPVSVHNVHVDKMAREAAKGFLEDGHGKAVSYVRQE